MAFLAIDAGGTKTLFCLFDDHFEEIERHYLPTAHINHVSKEETIKILKDGFDYFKKYQLPVFAIGAGLAGYGSEENKAKWQTCFQQAYPKTPYYLANDAQTALLGSFNGNKGILLICGTGSIAMAYDGHHFYRAGGWGSPFGDEGSGYWIGQQLLRHFSYQADGLEGKTSLFNYLIDKYQLKDALDILNTHPLTLDRTTIASLAKEVFTLAKDGDKVCQSIIDQAAEHLTKLANVLNKKTAVSDIAFHGSVLEQQAEFSKKIELYLSDGLSVIKKKHNALYGAMLLINYERENRDERRFKN